MPYAMDDLADEDRAILSFLRSHFEERPMRYALKLLDAAQPDFLRELSRGYRDFYELADYCGTSTDMIQKHYSKYIRNDVDEQLERILGNLGG